VLQECKPYPLDVSSILRSLYLLRHAKSSWHMEASQDFHGPLTDQGLHVAREVGRLIAAENWGHILIVSSPVVKASETSEIVKARAQFRAHR
jgi:phosphohistidine phosphatase